MKIRTILSLTASCLLLASCHRSAGEADGHAPLPGTGSTEEPARHSDEILFPAEQARAAGVEIGTVERGAFRAVIPASGTLLAAPGDRTTVVANVSGIVSFPQPLAEGSFAGKGTPLIRLSSARIQDGDPAARARIAYETARAEYERARNLVTDRIISQKEFESIRADYETARIAYEAFARSKAPQGGTLVESPVAGYVDGLFVAEGDYVTVGQPLMSLSQNRRLRLRADVPARYATRLAGVSSARFRPASEERVYRLEELGGRLLSYGRSVDAGSAYLPVTFALDNPGSLVPGLFAEVWLLAEERSDVIALPVSALVEEQGARFVYVQLDENCYRKQPVVCGATDGLRIEITEGLEEGERVVTSGAVHVRLAGATDAIPGHTHNH